MFKLNIECTRDITKLHIDFADGSSAVVDGSDSIQSPSPEKNREIQKVSANEVHQHDETLSKSEWPGRERQVLDVDADFGGISQDVVVLPEIESVERPVNVADELQNFDF